MITGPQSAAARALLGWTLADLARESGLASATLTDFENAKRPSSTETVHKITSAFDRAGISFTPGGVQRVMPVYYFKGKDAYADLLKDVLATGAKDVLIENVNNKKSSPKVLDQIRNLRSNGVQIRMTAEDGDDYLVLPLSCYRWVPSKYFKNWVSVTYADRVATKISETENGYIVVRDKDIADASRNRFDFVWDLLKPLHIQESSAHERID